MSKQFINVYSESHNGEIIVSKSSIAYVSTDNEGRTRLTLTFARGKDMYPKTITVNESYDEIKNLLME